jgi:hypothetical protein
MNARNRKLFAVLQDVLVFSMRFPVISRFADTKTAPSSPARLRFTRIAS